MTPPDDNVSQKHQNGDTSREHVAQDDMPADVRAKRDREHFKKIIDEWTGYWMNQTQNSKEDYENYFRRALGVDANMRHHLAGLLEKDATAGWAEGRARKSTGKEIREYIVPKDWQTAGEKTEATDVVVCVEKDAYDDLRSELDAMEKIYRMNREYVEAAKEKLTAAQAEIHQLKHDDPYFEENVRLVEGLAEANAEIKRLSGTVKCPTCGEEMDHRPDDAKAYSVLEIENAKLREEVDSFVIESARLKRMREQAVEFMDTAYKERDTLRAQLAAAQAHAKNSADICERALQHRDEAREERDAAIARAEGAEERLRTVHCASFEEHQVRNESLQSHADKLAAALEECEASGHHSICKANPDNHRTTSSVWNDALCDCGFIRAREALAAWKGET